MSFNNISINLSFINSFQFLSSLLNSLVQNLDKDVFKYSSQEYDNNALGTVNQNGFYPYGYMSEFEKFKEDLSSKEKFYSPLTDKKFNDQEYEHVLNVWNKSEIKTNKNYHS